MEEMQGKKNQTSFDEMPNSLYLNFMYIINKRGKLLMFK